ncbi:dTMP kinase [Agilicoccus flavus]|uniref:dTMP kinase n=1 Tax=Agilicoccus flavus TaxID=2775968 RepID=UPI001CF6D0DB|nr:dTMP kinase [Agilicoccus flavus]
MSTFPVPSTASAPRSAASHADGVFVVLEGGDGAGKTTQIERLAAWLAEAGRPPVLTREPGGTPLGVEVRRLLLHGDAVGPRAEALLFAADRAHHVDTVVRPALAAGRVVVSDRYLDSSVAYQGAGRDLPAEHVRDLSLWATGGLLPDLTVLLDIDPGQGRARRGEVHDRLESEPDDFHARVRAHFLALAAAEPGRYLVLDAARPADDLAGEVRHRLAPLLGLAAPGEVS